ncbi:unnamed protein product [Notodromas monacha]|uniref:Ankyrin repeat domain-containing protein n=1 Tax=Notodromas monacha TaxID=399045 RepID=A0A7R9BVQ6_9CRUS|nr:unnamed protein product [Notodromas monacha]CAG0922616.1 unnamed protein product [Notodromas monacha]
MLSARSQFDSEALAEAARNGDLKKVEKILDGMGNFTLINRGNEYGQTPLHKAAISGKPDVVSVLVQSGASIDAKDAFGSTPLHVACQFNRPHVVHVLLELGANDTITDSFGATPLQRCKDLNNLECERALLRFPIIKEMSKRIDKVEADLESADLDMLFLSEQIKSDPALMDKALAKYKKIALDKHTKMQEKKRILREQQMALKRQQEERIKALSTNNLAFKADENPQPSKNSTKTNKE